MDKLTRRKLVEEFYNFARISSSQTMSQKKVEQVKEESDRLVQILSIAVKEEAAGIASRMNDPIANAFVNVEKEIEDLREVIKELKQGVSTDKWDEVCKKHPNMVI